MDRHLKERLVGAVVLVAAANILIPPMLEGTRDAAIPHTSAEATSTDGAVKTYTIDLQAAKEPFRETAESAEELGAKNDDPTVETPSMPPNEMPETEIEAVPEFTAVAVTTPDKTNPSGAAPSGVAPSGVAPTSAAPFGATPKPSTSATPAEQATRVADKTPPLNPQHSPPPAASDMASNPRNTKPMSENPPQRAAPSAWAVQVASFSARATADRIVAELKAKGFPAFVVSFQSKGQTMYRVRVGPVGDRAAAETMLGKVKALHASANIVAHP